MSAPSTTFTSPRRNNVRTLPIIVTISSVILIAGGTVLGVLAHVPDNVLVPGVQVAGIKLGGKNLDEARTLLQQLAESRQALDVGMHFADETGITRTWRADAHKLGLGIDVDGTLDDARKAGRSNLVGQVTQYVAGSRSISVPARITVDNTQLRAYMKQIAYTINRKPKNANIVLRGNTIVDYSRDRTGIAMDVTGSQELVAQAWARYNAQPPIQPATSVSPTPAQPAPSPTTRPTNQEATTTPPVDPNVHAKPTTQTDPPVTTAPNSASAQQTPPPTQPGPQTDGATPPALDVQLLAKVTNASVLYDDVKQINGIIGSCTTDIGGTANRHSNVGLAASKINGTLLRPGETFSYNRVVGPRDKENGFKEAPEIVKGVLKPGIGGGVCQVSTTLYNAVLKANLKIVNRSHHAFPVHYVKPGLDATVVDGSIDFQFQNDSDAPIYVYGQGKDGVLRFRIFGKQVPGREVELVRSKYREKDYPTEIENDPNLPVGHRETKVPGHPDIQVTWFRVIKQNGTEVKREELPTHYHTIPEVVTVGTRPRTSVAPKQKPTSGSARSTPVSPATLPGTPAATSPTGQ